MKAPQPKICRDFSTDFFLDRFFAAAACSSSQQAPSFRRCSCPAISFHGQCGPCTTLVLCCWHCGWRVEWLGTYGWVGAVRLLRGSAKQWLPVGSSGNCAFLFVSHLALPTYHPTPHYTTQVYQRSIVLASWARLLRLALLRSSHPDSELNNTRLYFLSSITQICLGRTLLGRILQGAYAPGLPMCL